MTIRKFLQSLKTRSQTGRRRRKSELRLDGTTAVEVLEIRSLLTAYFVDDLSDGPVAPDMLADGKLTQAEADERLAKATERVQKTINSTSLDLKVERMGRMHRRLNQD